PDGEHRERVPQAGGATARVERRDQVNGVVGVLLERAAQRTESAPSAEEQDARPQLRGALTTSHPCRVGQFDSAADGDTRVHAGVSSKSKQKRTPASKSTPPDASNTVRPLNPA